MSKIVPVDTNGDSNPLINGSAWTRAAPSPSDAYKDNGGLIDVVSTVPGGAAKKTQRTLQSEEYVPVRVAREHVKVILAEMADMKSRHLAIVTDLEAHYNRMKSSAEEKINTYVTTLQHEHTTEMHRMQGIYKEKFASIQSDASKSFEAKMIREKGDLESQMEKAKITAAKQKQEMDEAREKIGEERRAMTQDVKTSQSTIQALNLEVGDLSNKLKILEKERDGLLVTAQRAQAESTLNSGSVAELTSRCASLETERDELTVVMERQRVLAQEHEQEGASELKERFENEKVELTLQLDASRRRAGELEESLSASEKVKEEASSECQRLGAMVKLQEAQGGEKIRETLIKCSADKEIVEGKLAEFTRQCEALTNERDAISVQLAHMTEETSSNASKTDGEWRKRYEHAVRTHQDEAEVLRQKLDLAQEEIAELDATCYRYATDRAATQEQGAQSFEVALGKKDAELAVITQKLSADLETAAAQLREAEGERDSVLSQLADLESDPALAALQERTREVRELQARRIALEEERDNEAMTAARRIATLEGQVDSMMAEFTFAKSGVEKEKAEQDQKLADADRERIALQKQMHKAIATLGAHSAEVQQLQKDLDSKEGEVDGLSARAEALQKQADDLDKTHMSRIQSLELEISEKDKALTSIHSKTRDSLHANEESLDKAQKEASALTRGMMTSSGPGSQLVEKLQANEDKVEKLQHDRAMLDVRADKVNMQKERQRAGKVMTTLKTTHPVVKKEDNTKLVELTDKMRHMTEENKDLKEIVKSLQKQCAAAQAAGSVDAIQLEVAKATKVVEDKLSKVTEKYEKFKKDYQETKAKATELEQDNLRLGAEVSTMAARLTDMEKITADVGKYRDESIRLEKESMQAKALAKECDAKWREETVLRKKLFNEILDLKGKIRVMVRCRPTNSIEKSKNSEIVVTFPDEFTTKIPSRENREFVFDKSYHYEVGQAAVWEDSKYFAQSAVDGFNTCIFAYGQTGSGKTFTMEGSEAHPGLTPRFITEIFAILNGMGANYEWRVSCYMLELYNENYWDLFFNPGHGKTKTERPSLDIKLDKDKNTISVSGAVVLTAATPEELRAAFVKGQSSRHTRSTGMNDASSRSHLVFSIMIETKQKSTGKVANGKLSLVDLAGSERLDKTGIKDAEGIKEAKSINKSLTALGNVINALVTDPEGHIPYRDNKLTQLMRDSLGGNAKTMMIAAISPASYNLDESINTMVYAARAKLITNDAHKSVDSKEVAKLKEKIAQLKKGLVVNDDEILTEGPPTAGAAGDDDVDPPPDES